MLIICEFGQLMTNTFFEIDDEIEKFNWYLFPHELQRMMPIIFIESQIPVEFKCFGSISATRISSKQVSFNSTPIGFLHVIAIYIWLSVVFLR